MNVHEYQAKELLARFGVPVPKGQVAFTPDEAETVARELGSPRVVVKAQIHAGGRGKGGGVKLASSPQEARELAAKMLGMQLVTHQTGPEGKRVDKVLVTEAVDIRQELYLAMTLDRANACVTVIASREGGVEIETVAAEHPDAILREPVDPAVGLQPFQASRLAYRLGLDADVRKQFVPMALALYRTFVETDASLVEVNPLAIVDDGRLVALDAKMNFDDNGLYRHKDIAAMRDPSEEDPREVAAHEHELSYVGLNGNIGCMVNGAGLAMATMDIIKYYGGEPANFLDVGGGADAERVAAAFKLILSDPNVKAVLVNIFGGIMKCDVIAQGILDAMKEVSLTVPLVVRLEGTNVERGRQMLDASGLQVVSADSLDDAAKKAVAAIA
jgi:succinyl-CoA synthetase beta subunit